jgi:hypothetical protein
MNTRPYVLTGGSACILAVLWQAQSSAGVVTELVQKACSTNGEQEMPVVLMRKPESSHLDDRDGRIILKRILQKTGPEDGTGSGRCCTFGLSHTDQLILGLVSGQELLSRNFVKIRS